ncbi:hypothetical protein [Vreelandella janggokensis]|uniref:hypothetical protein n=1 Tax=Vreelandella janggokensis TaxID=370767 RepID=UPI002862E5E0|nr:hypothetical protein [Halomonas janggokensis]MDR5887534.1 hypothetical protein [Halomonas janggokensis]
MAERGISYAVANQQNIAPEQNGLLYIPSGFLTPGFITTVTCIGYDRKIRDLHYADPDNHRGLLEAMQVPYKLTGIDGYQFNRVNQGVNYSPIQMLQNADDVDAATSETNNSIRLRVEDQPGIAQLCSVIGELHDNVRAHAEGMGFSMALNWNPNNPVIEFSVADKGKGFLRECQRIGVPDVVDDESAIRWCLTPRNTTKDRDHDEFAQMIPEDGMGNPFEGQADARPWHDGNNHQGLGLAKLMQLVTGYNGYLWVATGDTLMVSNPHTRKNDEFGYFCAMPHWKGVAIACRLNISELGRILEEEPFHDDVQDILDDILL